VLGTTLSATAEAVFAARQLFPKKWSTF